MRKSVFGVLVTEQDSYLPSPESNVLSETGKSFRDTFVSLFCFYVFFWLVCFLTSAGQLRTRRQFRSKDAAELIRTICLLWL